MSATLALAIPDFFWHDDNQLGGVPGMLEFGKSLQAGEWPLLSPNTWNCAAILGEYCGGIFSPIVLPATVFAGLVANSLANVAAIYAATMLAITGMGAFRLSRQEGLPASLATVVALVAALHGWNICWAASNWSPAMAGFAMVTWAWWAMGAALRPGADRRLILVAGIGVFLVMTAGWPHTIFMSAVISAWLLARAIWQQRHFSPVIIVVIAWLMGIGLSAPAWVPFIEYLGATHRPAAAGLIQTAWLLPPLSLPALVIPSWIAHWDSFSPRIGHISIELANGLVPTIVLFAALATWSRATAPRIIWPLILTAVGLALSMLPSLGMFRWSFRWLPLFHIALALTAGQWLTLQAAGRIPFPKWATDPGMRRVVRNPGAWAVAALLVVGFAVARQPLISVAVPAVSLALAVAWALIDDRLPLGHVARRWAPAMVTLGVFMVTYLQLPTGLAVPAWHLPESLRHPEPLSPDIRYLSLSGDDDFFKLGVQAESWGNLIRPGNTMMGGGVHFVNGYSALQHRGLQRGFRFGVHGNIAQYFIPHLAQFHTVPGGLLSRLGVDGIVVGRSVYTLAPGIVANGWKTVLNAPEGIVLHRDGPPSPPVRALTGVRYVTGEGAWQYALDQADGLMTLEAEPANPAGSHKEYAPRQTAIVSERRNSVTIDVGAGSGPALVALNRVWIPGYQAMTATGRALSLVALDGIIIGIEVPADFTGPITVRYMPWGLVIGAWSAAGTTLLMAIACFGWRRRRSVA